MAVSLSLVLSESDVNQSKNTSKVTAKLYATSTSGSYNSGSQSGYITIDGTKYTFNHSFSANTTTLLATKSKTVAHNSNGSKKVTVTGYYQTGVSSGNISTSKSLTLTTIKRIFSVHLVAVPGKVSGQDSITIKKGYGATITLPSAVRTGYNFLGWGSKHITKYSANADTGLHAAWSEKTAKLTYSANGHGTAPSAVTMKYSTETKAAAALSTTGYNFTGWKRSDNGTVISGGARVKAANVTPSALTLTAQWSANKHTVTFNTNGGTFSVLDREATYNSSFTFPTYSGTKSNYIFKGWSTSSTATSPQYTAGQKITWVNTSANGSIIKYYAVWVRATVAINYYNKSTSTSTFSDKANYKKFTTASSYKGDNYKVSASPGDITNYRFSGYWKEGSPCNKDYTSYNNGVSLPIGVIPISYTPTSSDGFIQNNAYINNITSNKDLYAVYRDNTPSDIKVVASSFDYVSNNSNDTILEYYKFLVGDNSNFQNRTRLQAKNFVASFKLTASNLNIILNENFTTTFTDTLGNSINIKRFVYKNGLDTYVIYTNETSNSLDEKETYNLVALNIKDNLGKTIKDSLSIEISPPNPIRDINATGTVVSFFGRAPDYTGDEKLNHPDNELIVNGVIKSLVKEFNYSKFSYDTNCTYYATSGSSSPHAVKIDRIVNLTGAIKNTAVLSTASSTVTIGKVPTGCEPLYEQHIISQGSNQYRFLLKVCTTGDLQIERYSNSSTAENIPSGHWLNITCTYISKD